MSTEANQTKLRFFVAVSPGLEPWLRDELVSLELQPELRAGGVEVAGTFADLMRVCLRSRLAESVRVRLKSFKATHFETLENQLARMPWHAYLRPDLSTHISVTCHRSRLYHSDAVLERCQRAIEKSLKQPVAVVTRAQAQQTVYVRLDRDEVETSVDASGELLHRRGYRTHVADAPLRETLAAALVRIAHGTNPSIPTTMWDPFCGSGTVMLEWLATTQDHAPAERTFAFEQWPTFRPHAATLTELRAEQNARPYRSGERHAYGSDLNAKAIHAARANAEHLGATSDVDLAQCDFNELASKVPQGSVVITNPPYGKRLGETKAVVALHRRLEDTLKKRKDLRPVVMACGCFPFIQAMQLPWQRIAIIKNGGLTVTVLRLD